MTDLRIDQIAKLKQTIAMLEDQQRTLGVDLSLSLNQTRELLAKLEQTEPVKAPPLWGVRLNQHNTYSRKRSDPLPEGCPAWAKPLQIDDWDKRGLIVWNNETHQFHKFWASRALRFLERLRAQHEWRDTALILTEIVERQIAPAEPQPQPKRTRKKKGSQAESPPAQDAKPEYETVEEERVRLPVSAGDDFFTFLVSHEATLREMAAADEKERSRVLGEVYDKILKFGSERKAADVDLAARTLPWARKEGGLKFVCDRPPNRATVHLTKTNLYWQACIEQPHRFKHESTWLLEVEEAMAWAEKELLQAEQEQTTPTEDADEPLPVSTMDLTPFWIDPAALEPARITYRVVIFIEHEPTAFKTMEMSFGELMKYDKEYPGPQAVARELEIDSAQMTVKQIVPESGLYRVKSNVIYFSESLAAAQAQSAWDSSKIVRVFQQGKIISAEYGYEEVETGYETHLGICEKPGALPYSPLSRAEYLAHRATRYTLLNALDVDGFRAHLGLKKKYVSDEDLLVRMHEERAKSPYLPQAARTASQQWLTENAQLIKQLLRQQGSRP